MHKDLKEARRSHETIWEQRSRQREQQCTGPEALSTWSAGGSCSDTEGGLGRSRGEEVRRDQRPHHMGPAGCWTLAFDSQRNGEPLEDLNRGVNDLTYFLAASLWLFDSEKTTWGERVAAGRPLGKLLQ